MNARSFSLTMSNCHAADNMQYAQDVVNEYLTCHCLNPKRIDVFDGHTQQKRTIEVACGECYHCQESKINEWTTRMYAHAEDFKHVYFITLTYRSFYSLIPLHRLLLDKLSQAVWHYDNKNETKRYCYSPCLLQKSHYQNFLKRLRKNTGIKDLTYVLSGEYGKKFGRPHFHAILFTNETLTYSDIRRAWSVALWRSDNGDYCVRKAQKRNGKAYDFPIGKVDFHDLVENGTFNTTKKIRIDGQYLSAHNCFAYVAKYVCKRNDANISRVRLAYNSLFKREHVSHKFKRLDCFRKAIQYCRDKNILFKLDDLSLTLEYDKISRKSSSSIYGKINYSTAQTVGNALFVRPCFEKYYTDFVRQFKPFVEFSRGTPIGSIFAKTHLQEFVQGVFNKPLLQEQSFIVPTYFRRKAQAYVYGLRQLRTNLSGNSYVLGGLQDMYKHFYDVLSGDATFRWRFTHDDLHQDVQSLCKSSRFSLKDLHTGERIIFPVYGEDIYAAHYMYSRHTRCYDLTRIVPLEHWLRDWLCKLETEFVNFQTQTANSKENLRLQERGFLLACDLGLEDDALKSQYKAKQDQYLKRKQLEYDDTHFAVE